MHFALFVVGVTSPKYSAHHQPAVLQCCMPGGFPCLSTFKCMYISVWYTHDTLCLYSLCILLCLSLLTLPCGTGAQSDIKVMCRLFQRICIPEYTYVTACYFHCYSGQCWGCSLTFGATPSAVHRHALCRLAQPCLTAC